MTPRTMQYVLVGFVALTCAGTARAETDLVKLDKPFLFAYGTWQSKAVIENGRAVIRGVTNQGGAGVAVQLDLSGSRDLSPALRVRVGEGNQAKGMQLLLRSGDTVSGIWRFTLPKAGETATLPPLHGAPLSTLTRAKASWT